MDVEKRERKSEFELFEEDSCNSREETSYSQMMHKLETPVDGGE